MLRIFHLSTAEPVRSHSNPHHTAHSHHTAHQQVHHHHGATAVDELVAQVQREDPHAHIRVTGRGRTPRRQAELMAQRRRANRQQFLHTYLPAQHITEMDGWVTAHPNAPERQTVDAFEQIILRALARGARVSNHLTNTARDVSIPLGTPGQQTQIRQRFSELGCHVIDEHDATGGPHWHVDGPGPELPIVPVRLP
jgi:hypothetical protein